MTQITNIQKVESKSKTHDVRPHRNGFVVTSGSSNKQYFVRLEPIASCTCDWAKYRKQGSACACSHVQAAVAFEAAQNGRNVKFHLTTTDTSRQKRQVEFLGDGVKVILRKAG
jgi:hypothetical protein